MRCVLLSCICLLLGAASPVGARAQGSEQPLPEGERIGQFRDARDLAVDDQGIIYVLDAEAAAVTRFSGSQSEQQALAGANAGGGAFAEPVDLDPTNGLKLIVADAGREELQWYSRSFRLLETRTLVPSGQQQSRRWGYGGNGLSPSDERGRPIAVVSAVTGELFSIDAVEGVIYRWAPSGRFSGIVGSEDEGEGRLVDPVDLVIADEVLYAADAGQQAVLVYDRFGSFVRLMANHQAKDIRALSIFQDKLYLTLPGHILVYSQQGRLLRRLSSELDRPLVDCLRTDDALYLLTETELFQLPTH